MSPKMQIQASYAFDNGDVALLCSRWSATVATPDGTRSSSTSGAARSRGATTRAGGCCTSTILGARNSLRPK